MFCALIVRIVPLAWNPVKELKDPKIAERIIDRFVVESGEGIERTLMSQGLNKAPLSVESGEGIERLIKLSRYLRAFSKVESGEGIESPSRACGSRSDSKLVESGEGIESPWRVEGGAVVDVRQWNPVKELKEGIDLTGLEVTGSFCGIR